VDAVLPFNTLTALDLTTLHPNDFIFFLFLWIDGYSLFYYENDWVQKTGDEVPPSTFSMTNVEEWDRFRNIDMDKEVIIPSLFCRSRLQIILLFKKSIWCTCNWI
jgi:hypothetical protein